MVDAYVYLVPLPNGVSEMVTPCADNAYTIYINDRLCERKQLEAYHHALQHISENDFEKYDVQEIESKAHATT